MTQQEYEQVLTECGGAWEPLSNSERGAWIQRWREAYAAGLYTATGKWKLGEFEWHVFSFQHARALNALPALQVYRGEPPQPVIVYPEAQALPAVLLRGNRLPDFASQGADFLVTPLTSPGPWPSLTRRPWRSVPTSPAATGSSTKAPENPARQALPRTQEQLQRLVETVRVERLRSTAAIRPRACYCVRKD